MKTKKITKYISIALACVATIASISFFDNAYGASYNITQSRNIKEIEEFPQSYQAGLKNIKMIYPNAEFIYYDTGLDWYEDLLQPENILKHGLNVVYSSSPSSWKSTDRLSYDAATSRYKDVEPGWHQASKEVIEYYMDPRNFFTEKEIFQFLQLTFDESQTVDGVQNILSGTWMAKMSVTDNNGNSISHAQALYEAGKEANVSPYLLASRVRQENGGGKSALVSGSSGYYNYFNVGAYGSTTSAIVNRGLNTAKSKGWDTRYKSLVGGAKILAENYVGAGKDCLYLHHWNMTASSNGVVSYSPYMTNMLAPVDETKTLVKSISDRSANYVFVIPVYDNMPSATSLPNGTGNSNFLLESLTLDDGKTTFGSFSPYTYQYSTISNKEYVVLKAKPFAATSTIKINGTDMSLVGDSVERIIMLKAGMNEIKVTVTAQNGLSREYALNVMKDNGSAYYNSDYISLDGREIVLKSGITVEQLKSKIQTLNCSVHITDNNGKVKEDGAVCKSDDYIVIKDKDGKELHKASLLIEYDVNQDGTVNADDFNYLIDFIVGNTSLSVSQVRSADLDKNDRIDAIDLGLLARELGMTGDSVKDVNMSIEIGDMYVDKKSELKITSSPGTHIIEGYLIYNEGEVKALELNNNGKIKFIAVGENVYLSNRSDKVNFTPNMNGGQTSFDLEIENTYGYIALSDVNIISEKKMVNIYESEIKVEPVVIDNVVESEKKAVVHVNITNMADNEVKDIEIKLSQNLITSKKDNEMKIDLQPGETKTVELFAEKDATYGKFSSEIQVSYNKKNHKIETKYPVCFELMRHEHVDWDIENKTHIAKCQSCEPIKENHTFYLKGNNIYKCSVCGYEKEMNITLLQTGNEINKIISLKPVVTENGKEIDLRGSDIVWTLNKKEFKNKQELKIQFNSIGEKEIDCVVRLKDGITLTKTSVVKVLQSKKDNQFLVATTCNKIVIPSSGAYEYRLNDGTWQTHNVFDNLETNKIYTVSRRDRNTKTGVEIIKIELTHHVNTYCEELKECGSEKVMRGNCEFCKKELIKTYKDTKEKHIYGKAVTIKEATCLDMKQIEKICLRCGNKKIENIENSNKTHLFVNYESDNNATCLQKETATAHCEYGCGIKNTIETLNSTSGHKYQYDFLDDATRTKNATEKGICKICKKENVREVDGTKVQPISRIQIEIMPANTNQSGLPGIEILNDSLEIQDFVWTNSSGLDLTNQSDRVTIRDNETYTLESLTIKLDDGFVIDKDTKMYVNGYEYTGKSKVKDNLATFTNVGQFTF